MMRGQQIGLLGVAKLARKLPQRAGRPEDRRKRRLEVMRNRGQQRRPQPIRLNRSLGPVQVFDQAHALDGQRRLIHQCIEQPPLIRRQQRARLVAVDADNPDRRRGRCASAGRDASRPAGYPNRARPA